MLHSEPLNVGVYARTATADPASAALSRETQVASARSWCAAHLGPDAYQLEVYSDQGHPGTAPWEPQAGEAHRPELARLVDDLRAGRVEVVIVNSLDRLSRRPDLWHEFVAQGLSEGRVRFVSLRDATDTTDGKSLVPFPGLMLAAVSRQSKHSGLDEPGEANRG